MARHRHYIVLEVHTGVQDHMRTELWVELNST